VNIPLGVCLLARPPQNKAQPVNYPAYIFEILSHAGLCYARIEQQDLINSLEHLRILVTVGEAELGGELAQRLAAWVKAGGAWLSVGGVCGMSETLGVDHLPPSFANWGGGACLMGEGYMLPRFKHPTVAHLPRALHFFGGIALKSMGAQVIAGSLDAHCRNEYHHMLFEHRPEKGRTLTLAVDFTGTIVRIQQGIAVTRDGVPAPDGSAPVADAVLKSGDGGVLDWIFDRDPVKGAFGLNAFLEPIADQWREVLLRCIFHLATVQNVPLPLLWLYPRELKCIAHLSHDSDNNEPEKARTLLEILREAQIHSTWCIILPGYDAPLMSDIKSAGHELATHYDAMTGTEGLTWGEAQFHQQHENLLRLFAGTPVTNKNHYLRWEGDIEFFNWCVKHGIQLDQSKGPSKTGEAGFNFGTCHPYLPVTFDNRTIDVLELPTLTQDLVVFAPPALLDGLIDGVKRVHGILHLLFHPAHLHRPEVRDALKMAIERAKREGMEWWTARQINTWERARRTVSWSDFSVDANRASASLRTQQDLADATVLWLSSGGTFEAWGFRFTATTRSISGNTHSTFETSLEPR
jgi:peptidoglycan/xylan/chitin deacetylase (PgdA/CDA1 family)